MYPNRCFGTFQSTVSPFFIPFLTPFGSFASSKQGNRNKKVFYSPPPPNVTHFRAILVSFGLCLYELKLIGYYPDIWLKRQRLKPLLCCIINLQLTILKSRVQSAPLCPSPITRLTLFIVKSAESLQCRQNMLEATPNQLTTLIGSGLEHPNLVPIGFPVCQVTRCARCVIKPF